MRRPSVRMLAPCFLVVAVALLALPASAAPSGHLEGYIPQAAHLSGRFNSFWTTDVWIYTESATRVHMWFNHEGRDNTDVQSVVIPLTGPVTFLPDILQNAFAVSATKGSIHYLADGQVEVVSRTWTPGKDGGSYGQVIYGIPVSMAAVPGAGPSGSLRMVVNETDGFRVNLGLANVTSSPVTVTVEVFTSDGQPAPGTSSLTMTLQAYDMQQKDDILAGLPAGQRQGLIVRASVSAGDGAIMSYLSVVDNTTNAANYQEAFRFGF